MPRAFDVALLLALCASVALPHSCSDTDTETLTFARSGVCSPSQLCMGGAGESKCWCFCGTVGSKLQFLIPFDMATARRGCSRAILPIADTGREGRGATKDRPGSCRGVSLACTFLSESDVVWSATSRHTMRWLRSEHHRQRSSASLRSKLQSRRVVARESPSSWRATSGASRRWYLRYALFHDLQLGTHRYRTLRTAVSAERDCMGFQVETTLGGN